MKKWFLLLPIFMVELSALPAAANMADKVIFSAPERAVSVRLEAKPGVARYAVASNTAFSIISENMIGEFNVSVQQSGMINGQPFGANAQLPGKATECAFTQTIEPRQIYTAHRRTASNKGAVLSQAVQIEIRYDAGFTPDFKIQTQSNARSVSTAQACD